MFVHQQPVSSKSLEVKAEKQRNGRDNLQKKKKYTFARRQEENLPANISRGFSLHVQNTL